jgi:hypothetical protein
MGGAKRPITIREVDFTPSQSEAVSLEALVAHGGPDARPPPEPPSEDSRRPITVFATEPGAGDESPAPDANDHASATQLPPVMSPPLAEPIADDPPAATNLPPTLVVEAVERTPSSRIAREDLAEMERVVDDAVRKAVREMSAAQAASVSLTTSAAASMQMAPAPGRTAAVGSGILLGASILDLIVLNWDKWIRGDAVSNVGWLQQTGIIGAAALAGAGAATAALARWQRRRARSRLAGARRRK